MTDTNPTSSPDPARLDPTQADELLLSMRRKMGTWVDWAEACQKLTKSGYNDQAIFEATGFEAIQQNQIMVAVQVYQSIISVGVTPETVAHFGYRASDVLYEFRMLSPVERAAAADFAADRKMDMDEAREMGKAVKDFSRSNQPPSDFCLACCKTKNRPSSPIGSNCPSAKVRPIRLRPPTNRSPTPRLHPSPRKTRPPAPLLPHRIRRRTSHYSPRHWCHAPDQNRFSSSPAL